MKSMYKLLLLIGTIMCVLNMRVIRTQEIEQIDDESIGVDDEESEQKVPSTNCVFVGCSCGDDEAEPIEEPLDEESGEPSQSSVFYDISCRDESNPAFKFKQFPKRDYSRRYSSHINNLDLSSNDLVSIPADRFDKLDISEADLTKNMISVIDESAFRGIVRLEVLELQQNDLSNINEQTFVPLASTLSQLKLSRNRIGEMSSEKLNKALEPLVNLKALILGHNKLTELPDLSSMVKLEELVLSNNDIKHVSHSSGHRLLPDSLVDLNLENNRIDQIDEHTFSNLKNLKYLNLESNQVSFINERAFEHLTKLTTLNLNKNYLKQIPSRVIYSLVNLIRLDLSSQNQMIKQIDDYAFDRRSNDNPIVKIDLSKNRITKIENRAFCSRNKSHPFVNIQEIDLALNQFSTINACIIRQLSKGSHDPHNHHSSQQRVKVSFKPTHFAEKLSPMPVCDCEITKSALFVELEGECVNDAGTSVLLRQYKCSGGWETLEEAENYCATQTDFDCTYEENKSAEQNEINDGANHPTPELASSTQPVDPETPPQQTNAIPRGPDNDVVDNPNKQPIIDNKPNDPSPSSSSSSSSSTANSNKNEKSAVNVATKTPTVTEQNNSGSKLNSNLFYLIATISTLYVASSSLSSLRSVSSSLSLHL